MGPRRTSPLRPTERAVLLWLTIASLVAAGATAWELWAAAAALAEEAAGLAERRNGLGPGLDHPDSVAEDLRSGLAEGAGVEAPRTEPPEDGR